MYAAHKLKYKTAIHEQNSIPGLSNKFLSRFVDKVFVSLPGSVKYFSKDKVIYTGNPRSEEIISTKKINKEELGFEKNKKLVLYIVLCVLSLVAVFVCVRYNLASSFK